MLTLEGNYKNGQIQLNETPPGIGEAKVLVTFLPADNRPAQRGIWQGMFKGKLETTMEDFKGAEWHGEDNVFPK